VHSSYSLDESHLGSIAIVRSCLRIIFLELIKLLLVKGRAYTLALPEGFLGEVLLDVASTLPKVTIDVQF